MMSRFVILFLGVLLSFSFAVEINGLNDIRTNYSKAAEDEDKADAIYNYLKDKDLSKKPVLLGYRGAIQTIRASHAYNPYYKLKYFNNGKDELEEAIGNDSKSAELRYLRITIQSECPSFLDYGSKISSDKTFLLDELANGLHKTNKTLANKIKDYLVHKNMLTAPELERIPKW